MGGGTKRNAPNSTAQRSRKDFKQVGLLTQIFMFVQSFICMEGKFMIPIQEDTFLFCYSQHLARLCIGPIEGLFELTQRPSRALNWPLAVLS